MAEKIAIASDHAGFELKSVLCQELEKLGFQPLDLGTDGPASVDYPDFAVGVAGAITAGKATRGVLVCGTGIGMAMAANKMPGVRAAACSDAYTARMSREHNDANVLALGARITAREAAIEILVVWLGATFSGDRHARRVEKIAALDRMREQECRDATAR